MTAAAAPAPARPRDHLLAAVATALVPSGLAALWVWLAPGGCDIRGSSAVYRWTCLLPGLMVAVPLGVAIFLALVAALGRRSARPLPFGPLVTPVLAGVATQAVVMGSYMIALEPAYRRLFFFEAFMIPQPFIAGAISGMIYWFALRRVMVRRAAPQK